jgi:hypothetical protein
MWQFAFISVKQWYNEAVSLLGSSGSSSRITYDLDDQSLKKCFKNFVICVGTDSISTPRTDAV